MKNTAQQLLNKFRQQATQTAAAASNTKAPISQNDQAAVRKHIKANGAAWLLAFHDLSIATGWRTSDCCAIRYSDIDFKTGTASITVSKQTLQSQARAMSKALEQVRQARKQAALTVGDSTAYMTWDAATKDELASSMTASEQAAAAAAVATAKRKTDQKALPTKLLKQLEQMRAAAADKDGFIFHSSLTASNRSSASGHISRVTIWAKMRDVFAAVATVLETAVEKLSAYSMRKSFAVNLLAISGRLEIVMAAFGHSSIAVTQRYLSLNDDAAQYQARLVS
ncbi:MAG: site-specific integrase [Vibrionaceae bacterium]